MARKSQKKPKKTYTQTLFVPYRVRESAYGTKYREYVKLLANHDHKQVANLMNRDVPKGAWIPTHGNGTRSVSFLHKEDAVDFKKWFYLDGIEVVTVITEEW